MPLNNTSIALTIAASLQSALDLGSAQYNFSTGKSVAYTSGVGASQVDKVWTDVRTIAASGTDDLDLAGALVDALGATITFVKVKAIFIAAADANTNNVVVGAAAANQFVGPFGAATHTVSVRPGGFFGIACKDATAYGVTAGTGDLLRIANSGAGTGVDYTVVILGTSA